MAPRYLSIPELLSAIASLTGEGPTRTFMRANRVGAIFIEEVDELVAIIAPTTAESVEEARLTVRLSEVDAIHDDHARFGFELLNTHAEGHPDPRIRDLCGELKGLLFRDGRELVRKSFGDEAGRFQIRNTAMTAEVRAKMRMIPVASFDAPPTTFEAWMDTVFQPVTAELGALVDERQRIARGEGPSPLEVQAAKRKLSALIPEMFRTLERDRSLDAAQKQLVQEAKRAWEDAVKLAGDHQRARRRNDDEPPKPPAAG